MPQERKRARLASEGAARRLAQFSSEIGDDRPLGAANWSPDGDLLAVAGWGGNVNLWSAAGCKHQLKFRGGTERLADVVWHPQARILQEGEQQVQLATGCCDGTAALWTGSGQQLAHLEGHTDRLGRLAFHPWGRHLVSFGCGWVCGGV